MSVRKKSYYPNYLSFLYRFCIAILRKAYSENADCLFIVLESDRFFSYTYVHNMYIHNIKQTIFEIICVRVVRKTLPILLFTSHGNPKYREFKKKVER